MASIKEEYREAIEKYLARYSFYHCLETPNMLVLDEALRQAGQRVCFMAEYFLPEFRRKGIASALTSRLALEILKREKVPFYCAAWSNLRSVRNAVKSGFLPAWVEMTAKPQAVVDEMNQ